MCFLFLFSLSFSLVFLVVRSPHGNMVGAVGVAVVAVGLSLLLLLLRWMRRKEEADRQRKQQYQVWLGRKFSKII
jgi:multisubunit Na+/H+ antiporter MnhB subunit